MAATVLEHQDMDEDQIQSIFNEKLKVLNNEIVKAEEDIIKFETQKKKEADDLDKLNA